MDITARHFGYSGSYIAPVINKTNDQYDESRWFQRFMKSWVTMAMRIFFASSGTKTPATYTTQYTELNTSYYKLGICKIT